MVRRFLIESNYLSSDNPTSYIIVSLEDNDILEILHRRKMFMQVRDSTRNLLEMRFTTDLMPKAFTTDCMTEMNIRKEESADPEADEWVFVSDFLDNESLAWKELKGSEDIRDEPADIDFAEISFTEEGVRFYIIEGDEMLGSSILPYNALTG